MTPKTRAYAVLALTFALGGLVGGGGVYALLQREQIHESREAREARRLAILEQRLGLDAGQRAAVAAILEAHREERRLAWGRMDGQIRALLRPEQQGELDAMILERKSRPGGPPAVSGAPSAASSAP